MAQVERAAQVIRPLPSVVDLDETVRAELDDQTASSPASQTIEDRRDTLGGQFSCINLGIDSGYASHASSLSQGPTSTELTENEVIRGAWPFQRKRRVIDKPIPQVAMEHLANLRILLSKPLKEYIFRPNTQEFTILWKLKYLGSTASDAKLYLMVSCDKCIASKVKRFFAQTHIRQQIGLHFEVYVQPLPPIKLSRTNDIPVYREKTLMLSQTLCGTPIAIEWDDEVRTATFGGIVMIYSMECPEGETFGLTAGHIIPSRLTHVEDLNSRQTRNMEEEMSDEDDAFEEDFELEIELDEAEAPKSRLTDQVLKEDTFKRRHMYPTGTLIVDSSADNDWALIRMDPIESLPNHLPSLKANSKQRELSCGKEPPLGFKMATAAMCGLSRAVTACGSIQGTIQRTGSGIMMSSGCHLIEVYDFAPNQSSSKSHASDRLIASVYFFPKRTILTINRIRQRRLRGLGSGRGDRPRLRPSHCYGCVG